MFKVSEVFNKEINKLQGRKFNAKVIIRDKEYSGNQIYEMNLEESVNPSDSFSIGSICSNSFDIKLINTGDIFDNAIVKPYVGLYIGDDIEYIPLGVFTVIKTSVKGKFINLECVDNMLGLEKVYFSDLSYPADINDIAKEICKKAGVNLASKLPNYRVNKIEGYSLREAIGFIASLCGSFARFNRIGDLEVRDYEVVKQEMTPHNLFKLDIEANECIIKKVIAKKGEEELSTGTDDGNKIVFNNPIITKEILSDIYTKYNGFKYIPYTAKWKGNPAIMAGDILNLTDLNGNKYNALIMEQKFTYKNGISSEVKAKGKTRQDSSFDSKGSVAQSMERYSIEQANIKKALIDKASINDLTAVDAKIQRLYTEDLTAIRADIVTLNSQKANIIELNSVRADLQQAIIGKANITDLNAAVGKINILESKTASIENALNKNLTAENIATGAITAGSGIIAEGAIGDAEISSLSVNKLKVGDITTSKHRIVSADGTIEIVGNQILINRNNVNRVILGEYRKTDGTTDYGLLIRDKDGKTIMLDSDGVHNAGITNGAIDNNKVADNANISGNKLDINSVIREVNNNGTETIKGTKVTVGDRTLEVELSTQNNTITEHSKELSSQKASLTALDNALKFKVDSQTFTQSTTTINNNINRAKEEAINSANNAINNLQISFRNLAINSNFDFGWKNWGFNNPNNNATVQIIKDSVLGNCVKVTTQTSGQGVYSILKRKPKTTYSWSFMIKSDKTCKITVAHEYGEGTKEISLTTEWTKITGTGIWNGNGGALCFYSNVDNPQITYYLTNLIYVEGDKVGDWTPAPEDLKAYSDDVAKAKADLAQANAIANADGKITTEEQKRIQQAQENLNIAISKADKAKQDAILEANRVAELKKQEAINSSNSHADSKANEALNNAKAFVNSEITNVNTHLNKNTSEINILKGQIESKVSQSDIDKSIQNIKFNDVNMILNSGEFKDTDHWSCTNGSNNLTIENRILKFKFTNYASWGCYISNNSLLNKPLDISKKYTVVCKLKASKNQILTFNICDGNSYNYVFGKELSLTTEWQIFKFTFNPTQVGNERQFRFITSNLGYDFDLYIEFVKMVEGATSSDSWSMAPDYVLDNIKTVTDKISTVESKLTQENNSIKASVQDLNSTTQTITTNINNINRDLTSKISSNLDVAKSFATDIATNKANTAKQEAINSSNSHADSIAASKATEALNNAKTYINAEISTVNTKVNNVESNLNILSDRINSKVSQSDIDKAVTTIRTEKIIYARGTGNDFPSNALVKVNGKTITDGQGRGLRINALNKVTLERVFLQDYDTFGSEDAKVSFVNKINELNNGDYIIIITSQDASYPLHPPIKEALEKIGATLFDNKQGTYREAYALIGKSKLGRGNGVEMFIPRTANDKRFAEVSVKVGEDGTFIGVNPNNMGLEATLITSNISDVSSELTQTKNSIEASINSINSKTQSIETNLNGKATKQELTEVNNRVATIKANLDSITQRVSNTESKTNSLETNINGKASKQELTVVNNKVTEVTASLNGITQRVGNTESRINALDGKVAGAVTLQQFTEFKQSNDKFKFTVEQRSSVSNILPNSSFHGGDRGWLHGGNEFWSGPYSGYGFKGRITGAIKNRAAYNNPERYLQTHKAYKVKKNTTYTINFHYICEKNVQSMDAFVVLSDTEHGDYAQPICVLTAQGGSQSNATEEKPFTYKFNTGNHEWVWIRFDHNGMKSGVNWDEFCWVYVSEIGIYEGDVGAVKWTPKGGEVYSANYQMDGLGFKGTFEDGTYAQLGRDGFEWYNAGTGHAYHALTYVTSFDVPIGNPGKAYIKLPAEFTKRRSSLKWTVALRGYYYSTDGDFFPFHIHCTGGRDYIENGLVVCEVQGYCKIQNAQNAGDVQFRPLTAMLIAIA
ncbi:interleukin-like EMT inducer domain-containing protein [Clostridium perfringens]|uniref:interleukin-like EMT inducer domain-containing protein n=1 Tax=Clostridium perfringens TaxID=1502 RepID=UPI00115F2FD7|nr:interleukin-like EMT inducer domain-containing protein [Clostridium perfringens]MDM0852891.1 interleukin-like EMT inducer domain-containing protein [Clostridium perfringens]